MNTRENNHNCVKHEKYICVEIITKQVALRWQYSWNIQIARYR